MQGRWRTHVRNPRARTLIRAKQQIAEAIGEKLVCLRQRNYDYQIREACKAGNFAGPAIRLNGWTSLHASLALWQAYLPPVSNASVEIFRISRSVRRLAYPSDGLLIRRSQVRALVGEPIIQDLALLPAFRFPGL